MPNKKLFYKFKNINDYTYDSLVNKYFYFSTPDELNDPEDCRMPIIYTSTDKNILNWIKHAKALGKKDGNDPNTFAFNTVDKVKKAIKNGGELKNILDFSEKETANRFHLLSLTDNWINQKMWDSIDYCHDFTGICIAYEAYQLQAPQFDSYFIKVDGNRSSNNSFFIQHNSDLYFVLRKMQYDNDRQHCYCPFEESYDKKYMLIPSAKNKNKENTEYNLFHKTKKWSEENEYRGFYLYLSGIDNQKIPYKDETLESITFGYKVKSDEIDKIKNIIQMNYQNFKEIKFYRAEPDSSTTIKRILI